jgi:hypothetical protein
MSGASAATSPAGAPNASQAKSVPKQAGLVLATLIIVAAVANLPLAMANVALPSIGATFDASQTQLNLVAVAYSLGLACSVLWLGALGDRYGRKLIAFLVGFFFRVAALWFAWEEPLPRGMPEHVRGDIVPRESLKEKMKPDWEPNYD